MFIIIKLYIFISDLLTVIHKCSKNSNDLNNEFSRVNNLSALFDNSSDNSDVKTHKRFWFKSDIIRLIANMCYNHKENQKLVNKFYLS